MYGPMFEQARWGPFGQLRTLQREMNRLFEGFSPLDGSADYPALNVWSSGDEVLVKAEIPGVEPDSIDVSVLKNQLTLQGERKADEPGEEVVCHRAERSSGRFVRTIRLPFEIENDKVEAKYAQGVLTIRLPRSEATKPKRVQVAAA